MDKDQFKYQCVAFVSAAYIMGPFETVEAAKDWCARYNAVIEPTDTKAMVCAIHSAERVLQIREEARLAAVT
jgi:hypothetical protein